MIRTGVWKAKGGSLLRLVVHQNGQLSGSYRTTHGRASFDEEYPLTGYINHDLIGFVVSWGQHESLTTWCGRYEVEDGRECIKALWNLARRYADKEKTILNDTIFTFQTFTGAFYWSEEE